MIEFSGVVIAGGSSTRMGMDKAFLKQAGVSLLDRQLALLKKLGAAELIVSRRKEQLPCCVPGRIVYDKYPDAGPIAGLASAFENARTPFLMVLAVDLPRISFRCLNQMLRLCAAGQGIVPSFNARFEPLAAIYPIEMAGLVNDCMENNRFKLQDLVRLGIAENLLKAQSISERDQSNFCNLNTPQDFSKFESGT